MKISPVRLGAILVVIVLVAVALSISAYLIGSPPDSSSFLIRPIPPLSAGIL